MSEPEELTEPQLEEQLMDLVASCAKDPLKYTKIAYHWGEADLADSEGPRQWQADILDSIGNHLKNPATRFMPIKIAVASGHGIGKSSLVGMITNWALSTCEDTRVIVTANTEKQLSSKTWPEITTWLRRSINAHWFIPTATSIASIDEAHNRTWRADAISWDISKPEAFAGLHNKGKRIVIILDEASAIPAAIWEVAEGALTDEDTEIIFIAFGNPTQSTGRFRECFGRFKHRWITKQIDSRKVEGTNKEQIAGWIEDYGEDSDFVRIRVKGEFPRAGTTQFIPSDLVAEARKREPVASGYDAVIMGVEVARFGDDQSVICIRRGRDAQTIKWWTFRKQDTMFLSAQVNEIYTKYRPDAIFVDGGGVGGGVVDRCRMLQLPVIEVQFGGEADRMLLDSQGGVIYRNKRAEMWGHMKDWLRGGAIPDDPDLENDLTGVQYGYVQLDGKDAILLEKKKDMKKRGLSSPDKADCLALTFAYPVQPTAHSQKQQNTQHTSNYEYNPRS